MNSRLLISFLALLLVAGNLCGQDRFIISKIIADINLDGIPDEDIWKGIKPFEFIMQTPVYLGEMTEKTDVRMFFTDDYVYVGSKLFYNDIDNLSAVGKQRDFGSISCDWLGLFLDTYHDRENSMVFFTNPNGVRWDATVKNDCADEQQDINLSWNTFWDVECRYDDSCWYSEFKIPISSLRFQEVNDTVKMGLTIMRFIPKKNETYLYPNIKPDQLNAAMKPSLSASIIFPGMSSDKPVYITPYLLAGYSMTNELNEDETAYQGVRDYKLEPGLDIKYGITSNLTLDLTVNTDFAQVEADDQQINLTRYSLFFPEKRVFFQEKSDIFDFSTDKGNNLFYSRRIGLYEGNVVRIYGGARLTGKAGNWDIGFLDMQTARTDDLPSENFGVLRLKRRIINENSYLGTMITSRLGTDGRYNLAYGLDAFIRLFGNDYLTTRWAQTFENEIKTEKSIADHSRIMVRWERRTQEGLAYDLSYVRSGMDYNPGVGFEMIDSYGAFSPTIKYGWLPENDNSVLRRHGLTQTLLVLNSTVDGDLMTIRSTSGWEFETRKGLGGTISAIWSREEVRDTIDFTQAQVPPGSYKFLACSLMIITPAGRRVQSILTAEAGQFYDGLKFSLMMMPQVNLTPGFNLSGTYRFDHVDFSARNQSFSNHIIGIKPLLMLSTKFSISSFIQYNTAIDAFIINGRLRYNPREGNDFYIVYNEGLNTNLYRETPSLPASESRTIMLKYTYTFSL